MKITKKGKVTIEENNITISDWHIEGGTIYKLKRKVLWKSLFAIIGALLGSRRLGF